MRKFIDQIVEYNQNNAGMHTYLNPFASVQKIRTAPDVKQRIPSTVPKATIAKFSFEEKKFIRAQPSYQAAKLRYDQKLVDPASSPETASALLTKLVRLQFKLRDLYRAQQHGLTDAEKLSKYLVDFPEGQLKKTLTSVANLARSMPIDRAVIQASTSRNILPLRDLLKQHVDRAITTVH